MSKDINSMSPESGRMLKENNAVINVADILAAVYDAVNGVLKTSASLSIEGDISIGAVELKDAITNTRATVGSNGLHVDVKSGAVNVTSNLIASTKTIEIQQHFTKNIAAGTEQTAVLISKPTNPVLMYKAAMTNSSIDSTLTVKLFNRRTFTITGTGFAVGSDATHFQLAATANPTNDHYNTFVVTITAGVGIGQTRTISDYVGATQIAEVSQAWTTNPDNTSVYSIALIRDSLAWTGSFPKASLTAPIVKSNDSEIITGLFDDGSDVYWVVSNDTLIVDADASRFTAVFQLIPVA